MNSIELSKLEPNNQEATSTGEFNSDEYVSENLHKHTAIDTEGITRSAYLIGGRDIVFRTRQESPKYDDTRVMVPGGEYVYPLERMVPAGTDTQDLVLTDGSAERAYVDSHQEDAPRIVVTDTPEGMLAAAALIVESDEERLRMQELAAEFAAGTTWTEAQREVVDTMLAAVSVDDQGKLRTYLNMDGWALALAALTGDMEAKLIVDTKVQGLIEAERERASDPTAYEEASLYLAERGWGLGEPIPLEKLALVHSTSYAINYDEEGNVILRTAGQQRDDKLPRASVHFTLNSRVGDVYSMGQKQAWADTNKIIVANLKNVIDASHTLPNRMAGMDTWFMLNPGETLKLPGALVVEQVGQTTSGKVIEEADTGVEYVLKDDYTDEEQYYLSDLARRYGVGGAKDIALRMAMEKVGVPIELMDYPSSDGHGMYSYELDKRVNATAMSLGLPVGKHFETPESNMERDAYYNMPRMLGKLAVDSHSSLLEEEYMYAYPRTAIESRRQALASGFYPARPNVIDEEKAQSYESIGSAW